MDPFTALGLAAAVVQFVDFEIRKQGLTCIQLLELTLYSARTGSGTKGPMWTLESEPHAFKESLRMLRLVLVPSGTNTLR